MKLSLISYESFFEDEADIVNAVLHSFNLTFHLRKPGGSVQEYQSFMDKIDPDNHHKIILHDAYSLNDHYRFKGVHFSTKNRKKAPGTDAEIKSTSCHSLNEIKRLDGAYQIMFLSPVFDSISKKGYKSQLNMNEISTYLKNKHKSEVIALGGISKSNIKKVTGYGFDGAAVMGAIWGTLPQGNKKLIINHLNELTECLNHVHIA